MTGEELDAVWRLSIGCFPKAFEPGSESVRAAWMPHLLNFEQYDVMAAIYELAAEQQTFPELATLLERTREGIGRRQQEREAKERAATARIAAPASTTVERRLEEFDRSAKENRSRQHAELAAAQRHAYRINAPTLSVEKLALEHAALDHVSEWETTARKTLEAGYEPGHAAQALIQAFTDPQQQVRRKPKAETQSAALLRADAHRIAAEYHRDPAMWPEAKRAELSPELRSAVNQELTKLQATPA